MAAVTPDTYLFVSFPPRHGKSTGCSKALPPWFLGNWPDKNVILTSYEADFASQWGRKCRDLLSRYGPEVFGVEVDPESKASNRWNIKGRAGGMQTAGIGGPLMGKGADLFIIDDPIKNSEEALSPTIRQKHWDWYLTTSETRLEPGASVVVIMHRWHTDDLVGRLKETFRNIGQNFVDLRLPAIAEDDDVLGREPGEALWPERYPVKSLERKKKKMGLWYTAQYQGRPVPMGGTLFLMDWFTKAKYDWIGAPGPNFDGFIVRETGQRFRKQEIRKLLICDPSLGQKNSDKVAMGVFGLPDDDSRAFVMHISSERTPLDDIVPKLDRLARAWNVDACLFEKTGFQVTVSKEARKRLPCPVRDIDTEGKSKVVRNFPAVNLASSFCLHTPDHADWVVPYVDEMCNWTGKDGDIDDQVDITGYAVLELKGEYDTDPPPLVAGKTLIRRF